MGPHPGRLLYKIEAYYPNPMTPPLVEYKSRMGDALWRAVDLMRSDAHTTITVRTPDALEVIRLWGQVRGMP